MKKFQSLALLASVSLVLSACGGSTPPTTEQPTVTVINGDLATWNGTGTVSVPGLSEVSAPVAADGTFALTLPQASALSGKTVNAAELLGALNCVGSLSSSSAATKGYAVALLNAKDTAPARQVYAASASGGVLAGITVSARAWVYADSATTITGTVDCAKILNVAQIKAIPVTVNVIAKAGWNVVDLTIQASALDLLGGKADGTLVNSSAGSSVATWRTLNELTAQLGF